MQAEHTSVGTWRTLARIRGAAEDLDTYRVAGLISDRIASDGVLPTWQRICLPLLARIPVGPDLEIAAEHVLSEGIRIGLDHAVRGSDRRLRSSGVLLAAAEREQHCLGLHAVAAGLRERGYDCLLLGAALPWTALADAVHRWRPRVAIVWAQTTSPRVPSRPPGSAATTLRSGSASPGRAGRSGHRRGPPCSPHCPTPCEWRCPATDRHRLPGTASPAPPRPSPARPSSIGAEPSSADGRPSNCSGSPWAHYVVVSGFDNLPYGRGKSKITWAASWLPAGGIRVGGPAATEP
ncbi:hypothetical protein O7632_21020 [Solwaraspora sp. WMMD406]|uniref:hypothetical protein n=1 Tax=Solwaraspora sp. WMMD406 TaxID=3016095 RepID=UPI0024175C07|nr:hypothetical protein [Solwaraspora sp. WMMD406]MDG4766560.1 hypothetical protein [Solwaraspora sp. WMMD406]